MRQLDMATRQSPYLSVLALWAKIYLHEGQETVSKLMKLERVQTSWIWRALHDKELQFTNTAYGC